MVGRFIGFAVMRACGPGKALAASAFVVGSADAGGVFGGGALAMWAVIAVGLCNSIMFPTIFSMSLHNGLAADGPGLGVLCMAIVGGALVPFAQGAGGRCRRPALVVLRAGGVLCVHPVLRCEVREHVSPAASLI
jgi:FHS family L-fucose permease-like MFS transporter